MQRYAFRKLTHDDFMLRVQRVDPHFAHHGHSAPRAPRSTLSVLSPLLGFGWFWVVFTLARDPDRIRASLMQGSLPSQHHDVILGTLAAMLAVSGVMILIHGLRCVLRRGPARRSSGGLLAGVLVAGALLHTPGPVRSQILALAETQTTGAIAATEARLRNLLPTPSQDATLYLSALEP
ncbi:MAG TPA: hypothetical protein DEB47_20500 [Citreicella sp.]|nr:hypothetical protein [Citreicella sp.]